VPLWIWSRFISAGPKPIYKSDERYTVGHGSTDTVAARAEDETCLLQLKDKKVSFSLYSLKSLQLAYG